MLEPDATGPHVTGTNPSDAWPTQIRQRASALTTRLTETDRRVLGIWVGAHLALAVLAWMSAWIIGIHGHANPLLGVYGQWDAAWYQNIAAHGYFSGHGAGRDAQAFLPGLPLVLAAVHLVVPGWIATELLVSFAAGAVALVCLGRLAGERAALYLVTAPAAMYLMVGYSEALFLALALPAWMAVRRRDWPLAALLAALAGLVRVNGLFLIAALVVAAATSERGGRLRASAWASFAAIGPALYEAYLKAHTGSWTAWLTANDAWDLHFVGPWRSLTNTWGRAFGPGLQPARAAMYQIEIACMAVAVLLTLALAWRRQWPEFVYCFLTVAALGATTYYQAVPRALLVMWPLYMLVARAAGRRTWLGHVYLWTCVPLAVLVAVLFFLGAWAL